MRNEGQRRMRAPCRIKLFGICLVDLPLNFAVLDDIGVDNAGARNCTQ